MLLLQKSCVKIYSGQNGARLENIDYLLPDLAEDTISITLSNTLVCRDKRKFGMFLRDDVQCSPVKAIFMPYLGDNSIRFEGKEDSLTWFHSETIEIGEYGTSRKTTMM